LKTILYIDDNPEAGLLAKIFLKKAGFKVLLHPDTEKSRQTLAETKIDFIITDLSLPGESGLEFYKWLVKSEFKHIPVLIISGQTVQKDSELAKLQDIFIQKPILYPDLISRINKTLS